MMSSPTTRAMMAARGKIPRTKQASSSSLLSPRRSPRHAAKQPATPPSTSLLSNSSDSDYSNNSGLLTPHSLTPEPTPTTRKKLYDKEIKAKAKARAAFNAIKLRNKLGSLKSARKKSTRMQSTSLKKRPSTTRNGTDNDDTEQALSPSASACDPVNNSSDDDLDKHIDGLGESGGNDNNNNDEGTPQPSEHLLRLRHRQVFMERAFGDEDGNNSVALQEVRDDIMKGVYDYKSKPRISYSKYHELVIGATSPCKRSACSCKNGCTKRCRCRQKNVVCNSTCLCLGNCTWSAGK